MNDIQRYVIAALIFLAVNLSGCGSDEPVRLGFISGQSGAFADLGGAGLNGAILAVEQRNQRGGVGGRLVTLIIRDDEHLLAKAKAAFQSLLKEDVAAVIGPMTSAMASELVPLADEAKIVLMGGTVVTNQLTGKDDYFLRVLAPTRHYAAYTAGVHHQQIKPARVHVVFDAANRDYSENWARDYAAELKRLGVAHCEVIEIDSQSPQTNPSELLARLTADAPDLITFATSARTAASLMLRLREKNTDVHFAVSAWAANRVLLESAAQSAEGTLVEQYHDLLDQSPGYQRFDADYRRRFQFGPDYAAVITYDATNIVLDGLAGNPRREGLKDALLNQRKYNGLQNTIELDRYGDAMRPGFTTVVRAGKFGPLTQAPQ